MPKVGRSIILEKHFVNVRVNLGGRGENQGEKCLSAKMPSSWGLLSTIVKKGKLRIGEYRIIYSFKGKRRAILVIEIGHRRDV